MIEPALLELLLPQLLTYGVLLAVILLSVRRAKRDAAEWQRSAAESNAEFSARMADLQRRIEDARAANRRADEERTATPDAPGSAGVYLLLTLPVPPGQDGHRLTHRIDGLMEQVHRLDTALGGAGVRRDPDRSKTTNGTLELAYVLNDPAEAEAHGRAIADVAAAAIEPLGVPVQYQLKRTG